MLLLFAQKISENFIAKFSRNNFLKFGVWNIGKNFRELIFCYK